MVVDSIILFIFASQNHELITTNYNNYVLDT